MDHSNKLWTTTVLSIVATCALPVACALPDADVGDLSSGSMSMGSTSTPGEDEDAGESSPAMDDGKDDGNGEDTSGHETTGPSGPATDGDSESDDSTTADDGEPYEPCCVGEPLSWGHVGSLLPGSTTSLIDDCDTFIRLDDDDTSDDTPAVACPSLLVCETDDEMIGTADITAFLNDPQFQAVIAEGSEFYGINTAPTDLPNFHFDLGGVEIGVGGAECVEPGEGPLACVPVPPIVAEFADVLQALTVQQGAACPE